MDENLQASKSLRAYSWAVIAVNLLVILWGAYVRATRSGAGCGSHWPLCDGAVIPQSPGVETMIEFTHRLSSGLTFLMVLGLLVWVFRILPSGHPARITASLSMVFMIIEALIGAGLVLFELVADNTSMARGISISLHHINTFLLLASLTLTALHHEGLPHITLRKRRLILFALIIGMVGVMILGVSGAVAALGDTLFPARTLAQSIA